MGREIRKVPANWQHPKDENGRFVPLFGSSWSKAVAEWDEELAKWNEGLCRAYGDQEKWRPKDEDELKYTFEEWSGRRPEKDDYMPEWGESELTHIQLYETTSEGTPKSPVFAKGDFEREVMNQPHPKTTRYLALKWWRQLSSAAKTRLCDLNTETLGIRRWESLTGREIEAIFEAEKLHKSL